MSTAVGAPAAGLPHDAPADRAGVGRAALTGVLAIAVSVLAMVVGLTRQPGSALDNVWAEDGSRFLTNAYQTPLYRAVLLPYSAYLHLYPRLAGATAAALPVGRAAAVLSGAGCLTTAAAAAAVVVGLRGVITRLPLRVLAAAALPLLPSASSAASGDVANAHVWLDLLALVLLLRPLGVGAGRGRSVETVAAWVATLLAIGSDPQALLLLVVVAGRIVLLRRRGAPAGRAAAAGAVPARGGSGLAGEVVTAALLVVMGAVQLTTVARNTVPRSSIHPSVRELAHLYLRDVLAPLVVGARRSVQAGSPTLHALAVAAVAVLVVTVVVSRARALLAVGLLVISLAWWAFAPWLKWTPALAGHHGAEATDGRYTVLSAAIVVLVLAACLDSWLRRVPWVAVLGVTVVVAVVGGLVWAPAESLGPDRVPSWAAGVRTARHDCGSDPGRPADAVVPGAPKPFVALVPCSRLR